MKPVHWLVLAEISFFCIYVSSIFSGLSYLILPEQQVNFFVMFALLLAWYLDKYITFLFIKYKVTAKDLLGET